MINLESKTIDLAGKSEPIVRFDVYFRTPFGMFATVDEAISACKAVDFLPQMNVIAVPIAVCANGNYEEWVR